MLDVSLFGLDSGWHHFTNTWIHALSTLLWFALLKRLTGSRWRSALVAFLFALHPLHVESVAWVAERKDVLSGLFWVLTLWAYAAYSDRPGPFRYSVTLVLFCLGLMAKPMLVTLPVVLLLLDRWPMQRGTKILEKIPFFAASLAVSLVTVLVHKEVGATASLSLIPPAVRFENSLVSYVAYFLQTLWPADLAVFYPYRPESLVLPAVIAGIALAVVTRVVDPRFSASTLPHCRLALVSDHAAAGHRPDSGRRAGSRRSLHVHPHDRPRYRPGLGSLRSPPSGGLACRIAVAAALCLACLTLTWQQVQYWRDSISLYQHAIDVTSENYVARFNLAVRPGEARRPRRSGLLNCVRPSASVRASRPPTRRWASCSPRQGQAGTGPSRTADRGEPEARTSPTSRSGWGLCWARSDVPKRPRPHSPRRFAVQPENADAHYNFGIALAQAGKLQDAAREFRATVDLAARRRGSALQFGNRARQAGTDRRSHRATFGEPCGSSPISPKPARRSKI